MGNDNSEGYNREERIKNEEAKCKRLKKDIDDMWKDPMFSVEEWVNAGKVYSEMTDRLKSLKEMNKSEKNFLKKLIWMITETMMVHLMYIKLRDL